MSIIKIKIVQHKTHVFVCPSTLKMSERGYIQDLRKQRFQCVPGVAAPTTAKDEMFSNLILGLIDDLQSEQHHFLFELIQNAEDNSYAFGVKPRLSFYLLEQSPVPSPVWRASFKLTRACLNIQDGDCGALIVVNNELGFQQENVDAICNVRKSSKAGRLDLGYIGEKGVGFKSVFMVCLSSPLVFLTF